jgi:thioredoxin-like negative regulator of GroEL
MFSEVLKHETKIQNLKLRNIDVLKEASISKFYEVKGVPTVIILKNKAIHARVIGEISETEIRILLNESNNNFK